MPPKVFLDANVLLDFLLKRKNYPTSRQLVALAQAGTIRALISPAVLHIIAYWLTKEHGAKQSKRMILALLNEILVVDATHEIAVQALQSANSDIEDALQYFTALHHKADYLLTWDKQFIKYSTPTLGVISPDDFIRLYDKNFTEY
jgi:predicted nucleic acid-binding protein